MLKKNEIVRLTITDLSNDGNGVGRYDGQAIFVPFTAAGDVLDVRIVKVMRSFAYGIIEKIITPSRDRAETDCPYFGKCGGCCFRHITYEAELRAKQSFVEEALRRIGGLSVSVDDIVPSPDVDGYRNKVQFPVSEIGGRLVPCFYYQRSHRAIDISDSCLLQPSIMNRIAVSACEALTDLNESAYDEKTGSGNIRHLLLRRSSRDGSILLCVICFNGRLRNETEFIERLTTEYPELKTIVVNRNSRPGNGILTADHRVICGSGHIEDELCGVPAEVTYDTFFQINHDSTENLYNCVKEYSSIGDGQTVIDLYCGTGTIGLSCSRPDTRLYGIETTAKSIESAKAAAKAMNYDRAEFICGDSGKIKELLQQGVVADVIITDPPRKGCSEEVLEAMATSGTERIVMVSCNPSTLARDLKYLCERGFVIQEIKPFDLFPRTKHVETVVLLCRKAEQADRHIVVNYEPR
ncbi:MAG: 23S rRNA (uracil(1939)-C(5))-methyltransferase RlmD [Oscillospiraceae bacterium]|nr:23S rRNA (uracil(1939)-C(5))-methyltransferase RlmD [Oscillospiraceae bacterium]MBP1555044.1 23S rRNA (uracil(1939)-C(5))-methyltransferase RlmD [Oscillospiraceae bacterium]